jgi:hypothetical protein
MPYLPPAFLNDTVFPSAQGYDTNLAISFIEERWRRFYTLVQYFTIIKPLSAATAGNFIVHKAGTTAFDTLYGESVDPAMSTSGWVQPHLNPTANTVDVELFNPSVNINARVPRRDPDSGLYNYGFDRVRKMDIGAEVVIPVSLLDRLGVTCQAGDKLAWDGDEYTVKQETQCGYWKNTNIRFYIKLMCEHRRKQSS